MSSVQQKAKIPNAAESAFQSFSLMNSVQQKVVILQDVRANGEERPWKEYKLGSLELAKSYERLGNDKASRVKQCAGYLVFKEYQCGQKRLSLGFFCQVRLCPMCSARRSALVFQNLREVIHAAKEKEKLEFIFLTLTAKTVNGAKVCEELTKYFEAWQKLSKRRPFRRAVVGWFRALEITHNWRKDTYHPHFHCILAVKPSYFGKGYIKQATWAEWWKESMGLDYTPIVDVRKVRPRPDRRSGEIGEAGAVYEVAKYSVKSADYLIPENRKAQDQAVEILDDALRNRRLVAYGGLFKEIRRELKHQDEDKHDLIKVGDDVKGCNCEVCNGIYQEAVYRWHVGYREYVKEE